MTFDPWHEVVKFSGKHPCEFLFKKVAVLEKVILKETFFLNLGHGGNEDDLTPSNG